VRERVLAYHVIEVRELLGKGWVAHVHHLSHRAVPMRWPSYPVASVASQAQPARPGGAGGGGVKSRVLIILPRSGLAPSLDCL
jgi:hypothetical protein